jgi:hypothetical protein
MSVFEDWFFKIVLPYFRNKPGRKAMVGDNLASHLSVAVLKSCEENDIRFILLPPNSTHLTQPLDVSFFRPLKTAWRKELDDFKRKNRGVLPKALFPTRLASALNRIEATSKQNILSGFRACGLVPLNAEAVLKRLPKDTGSSKDHEQVWSATLVENLKNIRYPASSATIEPKKKSRLNLKPGQSVQVEEFAPISSSKKKGHQSPTDTLFAERLVEEEEDDPEPVDVNDEDKENHVVAINDKDFVIVSMRVEGGNSEKFFVGQVVTDLGEDSYEISFLRKRLGRAGLYFVFPDVPDVSNVSRFSIQRKLTLKECKRSCYKFLSLDNFSLLC